MMEEKSCKTCGKTLPLSEFEKNIQHRSTGTKVYYRGSCKDCRRPVKAAINRQWREKNREHIRAYKARRKKEDPELFRRYALKYRIKHREKIQEWHKAYYRRNRDQLIERSREYRRRIWYLDKTWDGGDPDERVDFLVSMADHHNLAAQGAVEAVMDTLGDSEREYCEAFMAGEIDSIPEKILESIRSKVESS